MAALPTGAIPAAPANLGGDQEAKTEYFDALNKTLQALEARAGAGPNLFNVAGQFFNPGRTGSFGEALGNVAMSAGKDVERQRELEIPISQMRANIAGQKYQVQNEAKALNMFASAMGMNPNQAAGVLESGNVTPDMLSKIPSNLYVAIAKLDPKLGESIKNAFNMDVERRKLVNEDIKNGMSVADMIAKYGQGITSYLPPSVKDPTKVGPGAATSTSGATTTSAPPAGGETTTAPTSGRREPPVNLVDPSSVPIDSDLAGLPLSKQAEVRETRAKSQDKVYENHRNEIISFTPAMTEATANRLKELHNIADKHGNIFGLMQQKGLLSAIKNSAQEGFNLGRGFSVSLPVQTFVEKYNLSATDQRILRRASQLLAEQFFEDAKAQKSVLGPQISNADAEFMQRPMVTEKDAATSVQYWTKNHLLLNSQRRELFETLNQYDKRFGTRVPFGSYFGSDDYLGVVKKYTDLNKQLRERYPDFGSK
jgi:hypothetical protein